MRQIITANDIRLLLAGGKKELVIGEGVVITDVARDEARLTGVHLVENRIAGDSHIVIKVAGEEIPGRLLFDEAPITSRAIADLLPLEGTVNHARLAGDELMFPIRTYIAPENQSKAQDEGNIAYWPDRMIIAIFYSPSNGVGLTNVFGKITGNMDGLKRAGEAIWKEQGAELRIERRRST